MLDAPSSEGLPRLAALLGVADLRAPMSLRRLQVGDEVTLVPRTVAQATEARDATCKALYGRLFGWLVGRCNERLVDADASALPSIGILDIYGFESFATNSFEQARLSARAVRANPNPNPSPSPSPNLNPSASPNPDPEQLCINYVNEMLQEQFNETVFAAERRLLKAEGIEIDDGALQS